MERIIVDRTVEKYREQLQDLRREAELARQRIGATVLSPSFHEELRDIVHLALAYQPAGGPTGAIYTLAQVTDRLERLMAPWTVLQRYEDLHEKLREFEVKYGRE